MLKEVHVLICTIFQMIKYLSSNNNLEHLNDKKVNLCNSAKVRCSRYQIYTLYKVVPQQLISFSENIAN